MCFLMRGCLIFQYVMILSFVHMKAGTMTGVHVMITTLRQDPSPDLLMIGIMGCIISLRVPRAMDEAHLGLVRTGRYSAT